MRPASYYPSCGNPAVRLLVPGPWFCVIASRQFCLSRGGVFASILESNEDADSRRAEKELELAEFLDFRSCMRILSECRSRAILASRVSAGGRQKPGSPRKLAPLNAIIIITLGSRARSTTAVSGYMYRRSALALYICPPTVSVLVNQTPRRPVAGTTAEFDDAQVAVTMLSRRQVDLLPDFGPLRMRASGQLRGPRFLVHYEGESAAVAIIR